MSHDEVNKPFHSAAHFEIFRTMTPGRAEEVALQAVAWLVAQEDILPVFLGSSGASESDLRGGLSDPVFLGAVLDFIMMDDRWVVGFCDAGKLDYNDPMLARGMLPGGEQMHWT